MPALKLYLLGAPRIEYSGRPVVLASQKATALLFYLALEGHAPLSRGKLATLFWEESDESHARRSLNDALYKLRRALPDSDHLAASREWVQFCSDSDYWVDVTEFEHARKAMSTSPDALSVNRTTQAVDLYRGGFLDGFILKDSEAFSAWARFRRESLHRDYVSLLEQLARYHQQRYDYGQAIRYSLDALRADPLHESAYRTLMRLYYLKGDRAASLATYEDCCQTLELELDTAPSSETQELFALVVGGSVPEREKLPAWQSPSLHGEERLPLVDRDAELSLLNDALNTVLRGRSSVLLVEGEAGMGKTRLIEEFLARQAAGRVVPLTGRCHPTESSPPLQAFALILQRIRSLQEELPPRRGDHRWQALERVMSRWDEFAPGQSLQLEHVHRQLAPLLIAILREIARWRPVVLILDDYQWADAASRDLLGHLVRAFRDERILFIVAYRAEELSHVAEITLHNLSMQSRTKHLSLSHLNPEQTGQLARHITRGIGGRSLERRIHRRSQGNPLFAIELSRSLFRPPPTTAAERQIPKRIRDLVRTRLHRLDSATREFLLAAAVAGDLCNFATAQRASGLDQSEALKAIDTLLEMKLIHETGGGEFRFAYGTIRQVALEGISSTHADRLRLRVDRLRPVSYREQLKQASSRLAERLRLYQRQREFLGHALRSLLRLIAAVTLISLAAFVTLRTIPGGPFDAPTQLPSATMHALKDYYGVDRPPAEQYLIYVGHILAGLNLGPSYVAPERTVNDILRQYFPATVELGLSAILFGIALGVSCGVLAARRANSPWDHLFTGVADFALVTPVIVLGPLLLWAFSLSTGWLPLSGWGELHHLMLPAIALGSGCAALIAQSVRDNIVKLQCGEFIGVTMPQKHTRRLLFRRALRTSLLSLLPSARALCSSLMAGSLVIEQLFDIPGLGRYLVSTIQTKDYPVLVNTLLFYAILLATVDLLAEIILALLKPGIPALADRE